MARSGRSHEELRDLIGVHALGIAEADEADELESHVLGCAACAEELASARRAAGHLQELRASIHGGQVAVDGLGTTSSIDPVRRAVGGARRRAAVMAASAAAVVLVVVGVAGVVAQRDADGVAERAATFEDRVRLVQDVGAGDGRLLRLVGDEGSVDVVVGPDGAAAMWWTDLPSLDDDRRYVLWMVVDDEPVSPVDLGGTIGDERFAVDPNAEHLLVTVSRTTPRPTDPVAATGAIGAS